MAPRPSGFPWLPQSVRFVGFSPAYCPRQWVGQEVHLDLKGKKTEGPFWPTQYIPKQKATDPKTLTSLNFSKKVAETSIICSKIHLSRTQVSLSLTWRVSVTSKGRQEREGVRGPGFGLPGAAVRLVVVVRPCHLLSLYFLFLGWIIRVLRSLSLSFLCPLWHACQILVPGSRINPCLNHWES